MDFISISSLLSVYIDGDGKSDWTMQIHYVFLVHMLRRIF